VYLEKKAMPNRHFRTCMIVRCGHKCEKTFDRCMQCIRERIEHTGIQSDEKMTVVQAWGYEV
jgi:hypothetical protein